MVWWLAGVAWAGDKDRDEIVNKVDQCVDAAEDRDGFQDEDGCPDSDNDQDAVEDEADTCPLEPEDRDGFEDGDGCPDPDNDADGVVDVDDKCPAEVEDGADGDGCAIVTLKLLSETGYLAAIDTLSKALLLVAEQQEAGCSTAAHAAEDWLALHDAGALAGEWDDRLARAPEGFDPKAAIATLANKGEVYRTLKPALDVFCATNPAWQRVSEPVAVVYAALPIPEPPKKKRR